jgi:BA14K-like protein
VAGGGPRAGATVRGGGSFRGAAVQDGRSFQGGSRISRGEVSRGGDHFAGGRGFRGERRDHFGRFGLGVAAGVGLGYYGYDNGYYDDGDYGAAYAYEGGDDGVAYCMQRYRSYDPGSGTFLGYDGFRHPCP